MRRVFYVGYGILAYAVFFLTFLYSIGFVGGFLVPKTIDSGTASNVTTALLVDMLLLGLFAVQHSVMARPAFKRWWTQWIPKPIERSTYVLLASLVLILLFWQWRPISYTFWSVEHPIGQALLWGAFWLGWLLVLVATFLINHFDLFGLRQVYLAWVKKGYEPLKFRTTGFYNFIRHPLLLGFIIAFWAIPTMTAGHLLFASVTTIYMLVAIQLEERDLATFHGENYRRYQEEVPMLIPWKGNQGSKLGHGEEPEFKTGS